MQSRDDFISTFPDHCAVNCRPEISWYNGVTETIMLIARFVGNFINIIGEYLQISTDQGLLKHMEKSSYIFLNIDNINSKKAIAHKLKYHWAYNHYVMIWCQPTYDRIWPQPTVALYKCAQWAHYIYYCTWLLYQLCVSTSASEHLEMPVSAIFHRVTDQNWWT